MGTRLDRFLVLSGAAASVIIILFPMVIAGFFLPEYSNMHNSISRLGRVDSSVMAPVNASFALGGFLIVLFGIGMFRVLGDWSGRIAAVLMLMGGISGMLVGIVYEGLAWEWAPMVHVVAANVGGMFVVTCLVLLGSRGLVKGGGVGNWKWSALFILFALLATVFGLLYNAGYDLLPHGIMERVALGSLLGIIFILSLYLYKTELGKSKGI